MTFCDGFFEHPLFQKCHVISELKTSQQRQLVKRFKWTNWWRVTNDRNKDTFREEVEKKFEILFEEFVWIFSSKNSSEYLVRKVCLNIKFEIFLNNPWEVWRDLSLHSYSNPTLPNQSRCQFHQRSTSSFCSRSSQKNHKILMTSLSFFACLGFVRINTAHRTLMKLSPDLIQPDNDPHT